MKLVDKKNATATLAAYAEQLASGPVVLTERGKPVAALVALENVDLETASLSMNPRFMELIERSRRRVRAEVGESSAEMRRKFDKRKPKRACGAVMGERCASRSSRFAGRTAMSRRRFAHPTSCWPKKEIEHGRYCW